jgi:hypothetical protein
MADAERGTERDNQWSLARQLAQFFTDRIVALGAIATLPICYLGWVWSLPPADRLKADPRIVAQAIVSILGSSLGWVLFLITLAVSSAIISYQHHRIRTQGKVLTEYRHQHGVKHFSASDPNALEDYAMKRYSQASDTNTVDS